MKILKPVSFFVRGVVVSEEEARGLLCEPRPVKSSAGLKRVHERDGATVSMGFVVHGYAASTPAEIERAYASRIKAHEAQEEGSKHPGMLDEFERQWKAKNKPKKISKPYPLASSAETCADLARKAGWLDVRVEEVLKA